MYIDARIIAIFPVRTTKQRTVDQISVSVPLVRVTERICTFLFVVFLRLPLHLALFLGSAFVCELALFILSHSAYISLSVNVDTEVHLLHPRSSSHCC
jgi:hypothetical protein